MIHNPYLLHLSRYIHLNPVHAGLVEQPEDWEYSSYPEYVGLRGGSLPQMKIILELFGPAGQEQIIEQYRDFVMDAGERDYKAISHLLMDE